MKLNKNELRQLILEVVQEQEEPQQKYEPQFSDYEQRSLVLKGQTIEVLREMLMQLKTLTYYTTPARSPGAVAGERALAGAIQETEGKK
jgi:hypothetical protein